MKLLNMSGQLITLRNFGKIETGKHTLQLPLQTSAGIYLLQIISGQTQLNAKVVVE